ncbi:2TM domain-containing protein [Gloeocapsa sp. BRSZ]
MPEQYSLAEAQQILKQAAIFQQKDTISREQLLEIASETGISAETLQQAETSWLTEQQAQKAQAVQQARSQLGFKLHVIPYLAVSILLIFLNLKTAPRYFWSVFPVLGWGVGVLIHGVCVRSKEVSIADES